MNPQFNSTLYSRLDTSFNCDAEFNQKHKQLELLLSNSTTKTKNINISLFELRSEQENITEIKNQIVSLKFTYLVLEIKNFILHPDCKINLSEEYLETAHKKAVEILLPQISSQSHANLLFLKAFKFDKSCNLQQPNLNKDVVQNILVSSYGLLDFKTFKYSILKKTLPENKINFKDKIEKKAIALRSSNKGVILPVSAEIESSTSGKVDDLKPIAEKNNNNKSRENCIIC